MCRALALYGRDAGQIERLARSSPRAKSERADYWPPTVAAALRDTPRRRPGAPPTVHTPRGSFSGVLGGAQGGPESRWEPPEGELS